MMHGPFSAACERNRDPILACIAPLLATASRVIEIGSGTGQHAAWFAPRLPQLVWVSSDLPGNHVAIRGWLGQCGAANIEGPLALDVAQEPWPDLGPVDAAYSANTAHIMSEPQVMAMFEGLGRRLPPGAPFCLYGPFAEHGRHTAESNRRFDAQLRAEDPRMGVRDVAWLTQLASVAGFLLENVEPMPANNRLLVWRHG